MIHICEPSTTDAEKNMVMDALNRNMISSTSSYVVAFEEMFASKIGTLKAIAVNSGTSALFVALKALGIKEGDEVIVPTFTMIATANAVAQCGATPVFVDAKQDCNIDETLIEEKITPKTKAIIPVHLYGKPCEMDEIMAIAKKYGLFVVEDCAEAHGAEYRGKVVGSIGDAGCFSFYANKIITTGEGGAITTNNKALAKEMSQLRQFYFPKAGHYWHRKIGWNLRMSSLQAAYGLAQLGRWRELIKKRMDNSKYYNYYLSSSDISSVSGGGVKWMCAFIAEHRDKLMKFLETNGVETRAGFIPCHQQPPYKEKGSYPVSEALAESIVCLPSASDLSLKDKDIIINLIKEFYE